MVTGTYASTRLEYLCTPPLISIIVLKLLVNRVGCDKRNFVITELADLISVMDLVAHLGCYINLDYMNMAFMYSLLHG